MVVKGDCSQIFHLLLLDCPKSVQKVPVRSGHIILVGQNNNKDIETFQLGDELSLNRPIELIRPLFRYGRCV